ncbi:hypothetical protein PR048_027731 [Dryococelus australis]|uniref:Uncharacterized protein n=1 Tax=Dryococelus australis TaxID=614101 RepID=A0ABQ9GHB7_9NEOP|nr:hypothetical protein PR048_027731 [Dryococelus australis]
MRNHGLGGELAFRAKTTSGVGVKGAHSSGQGRSSTLWETEVQIVSSSEPAKHRTSRHLAADEPTLGGSSNFAPATIAPTFISMSSAFLDQVKNNASPSYNFHWTVTSTTWLVCLSFIVFDSLSGGCELQRIRGGVVVRLLTPSTEAKRVQFPAGPLPGFSSVETFPNDVTGRRVFSAVSRLPALRCCSIFTSHHPHWLSRPPPKYLHTQEAEARVYAHSRLFPGTSLRKLSRQQDCLGPKTTGRWRWALVGGRPYSGPTNHP